MRKRSNQTGFTLIELVIIIAVLGILAAVAIPKYANITAESKEASTRGALGGLRSGITIYYANMAVTTGTAAWPSLTDVATPGTVMEQAVPANPYQNPDSAADSIVLGDTKGTPVGTRGGWVYNPETGEIWANTNVVGESAW